MVTNTHDLEKSAVTTVVPGFVVYANADEFLETHSGLIGFSVPCRKAKVNSKELAELAVTVAFVTLVEEEYIRLYVDKRPGFLGMGTVLETFAERLERDTTDPEPDQGLAGKILRTVRPNQEAKSIKWVVARLMSTSTDPWEELLDFLKERMVESGYFVEGEWEGIARFFKFLLGTKLEPRCEHIAGLREHIHTISRMLNRFRQMNPELYDQLRKDIHRGVVSQKEVDIDDD
jgi:hypothetical protein